MSNDPYPCETCKQMVVFHLGTEKLYNYTDGFGGKKGELHSHFGNITKKEKTFIQCNRCLTKYDSDKYYQCYYCFRQVCQRCGYMFVWSNRENTCSRCKYHYTKILTITIYDPKVEKYVKKDSAFINYEILEIIKEHDEIESTRQK